jgi:hypothetical protein
MQSVPVAAIAISLRSGSPRKGGGIEHHIGGMSRSLLKFAERTLLFKSYAASAI